MATSELPLAIKPSLTAAELDDAGALVREASWNQIEADWDVFLALGRVYAVATTAGRIIATTATLPFGGAFAWISMVLVAGEHRRQGLATRLMQRAMDNLAAAGLVPVLDATPDGRAVYRALGFEDAWGFHRLVRREAQRTVGTPVGAPQGAPLLGARGDDTKRATTRVAPTIVRPITDGDWPTLVARDAAAFGADRSAVLARLRGRLPAAELIAERNGRYAGFLLGRDGRVASHVGPLIAEDDDAATALLTQALARLDGPLIIDLADAKIAVRSWLEAQGFTAVRPFTRMLRGRSQRFDDPDSTFAVVGPEFG